MALEVLDLAWNNITLAGVDQFPFNSDKVNPVLPNLRYINFQAAHFCPTITDKFLSEK